MNEEITEVVAEEVEETETPTGEDLAEATEVEEPAEEETLLEEAE